MKEKMKIENLEFILKRMKEAQEEHPKAIIYFDWETNEIRISYPLPKDFREFKEREGKTWFDN